MSGRFTSSEVSRHCSENDCWVIIEGKVYDLSGFLASHPGGKGPVLKYAGKDATRQFMMLHDRSVLIDHPGLCIGLLDESIAHSVAASPSGKGSETGEWVFGEWKPPAGAEKVPVVAGTASIPSPESGGTAHILPSERNKATFDVFDLTTTIDGGVDATKHRRWLWSTAEHYDNSCNIFLDRSSLVSQHVTRFVDLHRSYSDSFRPGPGDITLMVAIAKNGGALSLHYGAFLPTLLSQATPEQLGEWLYPALTCGIIGCLAQTELGHGSNVRALQTTATYDPSSREFILDTPTLLAMKWWPGGLGMTATHAALYAQLVVDGKEVGFHVFLVQLRDASHNPLSGVEIGEVGPKIGDNCTETGYLRLNSVRIPRDWMLMKNQQVTEDGRYIRKAKAMESKAMYSTMLAIRAGLVAGAGYALARGVTISIRYSCVRKQGFEDTTNPSSNRFSSERAVIDYTTQKYRLLKQLSIAYAFLFSGKQMSKSFSGINAAVQDALGSEEGPTSAPSPVSEANALAAAKEMHASSAGLKALCTFIAAEGLEDCRKCCGGHGVLLASGVAQLASDYVTVCTAEGDRIILELQCARFLMNTADTLQKTSSTASLSDVCGYLSPLASVTASAGTTLPFTTDSDGFVSLPSIMALFEQRALSSVRSTRAKLNQCLQANSGLHNSFDVSWNACALQLVDVSRHHCWSIIMRNFVKKVESVPIGPVKTVLTRVCQLFGLSHVRDNAGDWLGTMTMDQLEAVNSSILKLLDVLRPDAVTLVDAFEFPDSALNSALGKYDGNVYEALYRSAKSSPLNTAEAKAKVAAAVAPYLDKDFLEQHAKMVRCGPSSKL